MFAVHTPPTSQQPRTSLDVDTTRPSSSALSSLSGCQIKKPRCVIHNITNVTKKILTVAPVNFCRFVPTSIITVRCVLVLFFSLKTTSHVNHMLVNRATSNKSVTSRPCSLRGLQQASRLSCSDRRPFRTPSRARE